jgi:kinetochore protein Mis13/DSN1
MVGYSDTFKALPHHEVDTADFYKHIESEGLSEPRRMRQLLTWCATRAMGAKPSGSRSEDESARLAGRILQIWEVPGQRGRRYISR